MKSCIARWADIKHDLASVSEVTVSHDLQKLATNYTRLSAEWCNKDRVIEVLYCKEK